ncbi:MAG TPA: DedA family protein [Usitatibacter sp.]|jgi:membrane protein DedA with SNARE-associated domain|nr:DedA family protein [Usitatibacter sp.]
MDLPALIDAYGYAAVFVGAFLEGETLLALGGLAARRGYLDFAAVVAIALAAGFAGDQFFFFLGRFHGQALLRRFPRLRARAERFDAMLARWHAPLIVAVRFMYGLRILGPIMLGMGRVRAWKFVAYNLLGAAIWAPLIASLGYVFGAILESVLKDLNHVEAWAFATVLALGVGGALVHRWRDRSLPDDPPA